jgi:hypothetical protein
MGQPYGIRLMSACGCKRGRYYKKLVVGARGDVGEKEGERDGRGGGSWWDGAVAERA